MIKEKKTSIIKKTNQHRHDQEGKTPCGSRSPVQLRPHLFQDELVAFIGVPAASGSGTLDEVAEQRLVLREVDHLGDVGVPLVSVAIVAVGNDGNPDVFYLAITAMTAMMAMMAMTAMMFLTSAFSLLIASFTPLLT